ncbi:hypothetical protein [Nitrosospira sp. Nsp1]|uniref:hypothetical protein n=1 Tax=Nitrosospira sp. Nsp1 TaxID=136547 RepID=UPI0015A173C2|nr:hypothetical protein [Nitrosospira sp. Nsp1]
MSAVSAPEFAMLARKVAKNWMGWKSVPAPAANARKAAEAWRASSLSDLKNRSEKSDWMRTDFADFEGQ